MKFSGFLLNVDYSLNSITLWIKTKNGIKQITDKFDPYIYLEAPEHIIKDIELLKLEYKGQPIEIKDYKRVKKWVKGKEKELLKIYCYSPNHIPLIKRALEDFQVYEHKIRFLQKYLIDKELWPLKSYEFTYDEKFEKIEKITPIQEKENFNILGFDIETYNPSGMPDERTDPVIMISYADDKEAKVLTYKNIKKDFIINYKNETEMIEGFCEIVNKKEIDFILGYNINQFDFPYLRKRSRNLGIDFTLGRNNLEILVKKAGQRKRIEIPGRIPVDLYPVARFLSNIGAVRLTRFTLKKVYQELMGEKSESKELVKKDEIWEMWDDDEKREILSEYSLGDSQAVMEISKHLLPVELELTKVSGLPLEDTTNSATGRLVESLLMRKAHERNEIIPEIPRHHEVLERQRNPIKAAYVKIPEPGIYTNIAVFDFRSLYPSIIISHNIDPFTLNCDCCEDAHISPLGHKFCKKRKGIIPETLEELITKRIELKKEMKKLTKESEEYNKIFAHQWALKILANSFYGQTVYPRARWYSRECGSSITAWGRHYILSTIEKAEKLGFDVLYSDSITKDRFVTILDPNGNIKIQNIEKLFNKHHSKIQKIGEKEYINIPSYSALTMNPKTMSSEWKAIKKIIRHKTNKKIFRVSQKYGETVVTEDHSIIIEKNGKLSKVKPKEMLNNKFIRVNSIPKVKKIEEIDIYEYLKDVKYETKYKGYKKITKAIADNEYVWVGWQDRKIPIKIKRFIPINSPEFESLCRLLGSYIPEGSSSTPETTLSRWGASIASSDLKFLKQLKKDYEILFKNAKSCIIRSTTKTRKLKYSVRSKIKYIQYEDKTHKLQMMNKLAAIFFKVFCGQKSTGKKIPYFIFHVPKKYKKILLAQMILGDGSHSVNIKLGYSKKYIKRNFKYTTRSLHLISGLSLLLNQLGRNYYITYRPSKKVYTLGTSENSNKFLKTKIIEEEYDGFVYDLSIEDNNMFTDSCGQILLHNTDSILLVLKNKTKKDALNFMESINKELPGNMELELEDFYPRGVFVSKRTSSTGAKKKYALIDEKGMIKIRGFELVRRDWSKIAKKTQMNVLKAILKDGDKEKAVKIVKDTIKELKEGKVDLEDLEIFTRLQKSINSYAIKSPEVSAAKKAIKRGKKIDKGSLIGYVITKKGNSISDKSELLEFAEDYDADYYIDKQIMPAVLKILKELGYEEDELKSKGKQIGLDSFF